MIRGWGHDKRDGDRNQHDGKVMQILLTLCEPTKGGVEDGNELEAEQGLDAACGPLLLPAVPASPTFPTNFSEDHRDAE